MQMSFLAAPGAVIFGGVITAIRTDYFIMFVRHREQLHER